MSAISDQYAIALFEVSKEEDNLNAISDAYESFLEAIDQESMEFFLHPGIDKATKTKVIQKTDIPTTLKNFLSVLIQNNRFKVVKAIKRSFDDLLDTMHNRMDILVYSKKKLTNKRSETLKAQYEKTYSRQVTINNVVDPDIIGGLRFEFDGLVIDDTVNRTLNDLKRHLTK